MASVRGTLLFRYRLMLTSAPRTPLDPRTPCLSAPRKLESSVCKPSASPHQPGSQPAKAPARHAELGPPGKDSGRSGSPGSTPV